MRLGAGAIPLRAKVVVTGQQSPAAVEEASALDGEGRDVEEQVVRLSNRTRKSPASSVATARVTAAGVAVQAPRGLGLRSCRAPR